MESLRKYYTARLIAVAIGITGAVLVIDNLVLPFLLEKFGEAHGVPKIAEGLTSRVAIVVYLFGGELVIRKYLWKFENKDLDFGGVWEGETNYKVAQIGEGPVPFSAPHDLLITQDCRSIKVSPTSSEDYLNWGSLAESLPDRDTFRYAYWVNYDDDTGKFPDKAKGYEELKVTKRDDNERPTELVGDFFHCAQGMTPVYSGTVKFKRKA